MSITVQQECLTPEGRDGHYTHTETQSKKLFEVKQNTSQIIQTDTIHDKYAGVLWAQRSWHGLYFQGEFEANEHHITWIYHTSLVILSGSLITAEGDAAKS